MKKKGYTRMLVSPSADTIAALPDGKMPPLWLRTSFIDEESPYRDIDKVYLPVEAFGEALEQFLCACHDGVPMVQDGGHVYVPGSWLMRQRPDVADQVKVIVKRVIKANRDG